MYFQQVLPAGDERPKGRRDAKDSSIKAKLKFPCHETDGLDGIRVGTLAGKENTIQ